MVRFWSTPEKERNAMIARGYAQTDHLTHGRMVHVGFETLGPSGHNQMFGRPTAIAFLNVAYESHASRVVFTVMLQELAPRVNAKPECATAYAAAFRLGGERAVYALLESEAA